MSLKIHDWHLFLQLLQKFPPLCKTYTKHLNLIEFFWCKKRPPSWARCLVKIPVYLLGLETVKIWQLAFQKKNFCAKKSSKVMFYENSKILHIVNIVLKTKLAKNRHSQLEKCAFFSTSDSICCTVGGRIFWPEGLSSRRKKKFSSRLVS